MRSIKEIKADIARLEAELKAAQALEQERRSQQNLAKIDALLVIFDRHTRTTCSDEDPINYGRCNRCTVLEFKRGQYWDSAFDLQVDLIRVED